MTEPVQNFIGDNKRKTEKIDCKIYLMSAPCDEHIDVQYNIAEIFNIYFKKNKRRCRAFTDSKTPINLDNYVKPDVKIICRESRNDDIPVIVVEILSNSTRGRDLGIKMKRYAELGVKEYWIITWELTAIDIYLLNDNKVYEYYKSYALKSDEDELKEIVTEFSPPSFPELKIQLEDVFYIFE
ncbi:MAG: Uma2 family endonuclease [Oscillospiraceae bacterium]|nr:Uma2 family endonuclease [Oscillospiraceae bacterium]